ncbi:sugar ABC transporter substrate-binding protein [Bacillus songklensis]|uniref:Sugar ABC transporter substrate-binding protein n=1 Tax=Bacillus songklensis TaxID=1069116 RepID=A0ABV8B8A0_9BACI
MKKSPLFLLICGGLLAFIIVMGFIAVSFKEEDKPKVVVVLKTGSSQYWKMVEMGARKAFKDFGIDGKVVASNSEFAELENKQLSILKTALAQNPDALVVASIAPFSSIPILEEYSKKNIPVLTVDTDIGWSKQAAFIGTDNYVLGKKSAELLTSMLQSGDRVVILGGRTNNPVMIDRIKGAEESFEAAGIEVALVHHDVGEAQLAKAAMETILKRTPDINGVFASNDEMALGALKALEEQGKQIPVVGTDGIIDIVKLVKEGKMSAAIAQNTYDMGYISVEQALKAIEKKPVEKRIDVGIDIITKENAKERMVYWEEILGKP